MSLSLNMTTLCLMAATIVLILDQATKLLVQRRPTMRTRRPTRFGPRIRLVSNTNIGFGFIRDPRILIAVWCAALFGTIVLVNTNAALQNPLVATGLGAAVGGAAGNLVDMLRRGSVVDFIDLRVWPVFNLADTAIVVGVVFSTWIALGIG